jgi:positive regulator of sigma E activity
MPKVLCMTGIVVSILVFFIFLLHLVIPSSFAPASGASRMMDIVFILCAAGLGYLSWTTLKEQD